MTSFYQGHVREPVFLALTRGWLWALDGQDAAVSFASITGSTLSIVAAFLLGSALLSRPAGLVAAGLLAIEREAITWAPDGWRDDTFTASVLFAAWALVRVSRQPSTRNAVVAGLLCGIACLTRITALTFIVPALVWLVIDGSPRRPRAQQAAMAFAALAIVVAPYLVSCAVATGDPLIAVNYHTIYYRHAEGMPIAEPMSAAEYFRTKLANRPIATLDTAFNGLFVRPFITKWNGFGHWVEGLASVLQWLAVAGLGGLAFIAPGRLLLVVLVTSLAPYMVTWNVGGGGQWRFTMHVYPFYLVASGVALAGGLRLIRSLAAGTERRAIAKRLVLRGTAVAGVLIAGVVVYLGAPWFVIREAIASGDAASVETGYRDLMFYRGGWTAPHREGIWVRVSRGERSTVRIPLAAGRSYDIVLRIDPVDPAAQDRVSVLFNGHFVSAPRLAYDPKRVGSYPLRVQPHMVRSSNELVIIPSSLVAAGAAGRRFAWIDPDEQIGVRLWYVRVIPLP
jgi:hypothetical protein